MTKTEIIAHAARELGETSDGFKTAIVKPAFELVLLELAQEDCLDLRRTATFRTVLNQRTYEVREITSGQAHQVEVLEINAYPWSARIEQLPSSDFTERRLAMGDAATGRPLYWRQFPDRKVVELLPPCNADNAGVELQVVFETNPGDIPDDDELTLVMERELPAIIDGIKLRCGFFSQDMAQMYPLMAARWENAKGAMRGRLHNDRPTRIPVSDNGW